jgi:hypothetical protein|tara:strand:- start:63 stop:515 length:453 start_codon:yes stop_codon:yes gene_type:complete
MKKYKVIRNNGTPSRRKFEGFNFYIQCNEKLSRRNRKELISKSEVYLNKIFNSIRLTEEEKTNKGITNELDSNLTDYELLEIWNPIYEKYGFLIPDFKDKWESRHLKEDSNFIKTSNIDKFESKINELEFRIKLLENKLLKSKYVKGFDF